MSPQRHPEDPDSLEVVELMVELEDLTTGEPVGEEERRRRIRGIRARLKHFDLGVLGEFLDGDDDDDLLASLVRKLGPKGPQGKSGAAARPEGH